MANPFYNPTGNPATGAEGLSALMRGEFAAISAGFDLFGSTSGFSPGLIAWFNALFLAWMASLPTTLPAGSGMAWNNGGIPSVS